MPFRGQLLGAPSIFVDTPSITCEISVLSFRKSPIRISYEAYGLAIRNGPTDCRSV